MIDRVAYVSKLGTFLLALAGLGLAACNGTKTPVVASTSELTAMMMGPAQYMNTDPDNIGCKPGAEYVQSDLVEPVKIAPGRMGVLATQMVIGIRNRCVPVWNTTTKKWDMQTLALRTYGHPSSYDKPLTKEQALTGTNVTWSAPGPTFVLHTASAPGLSDGTRFKMDLYNAMPWQDDPHACDVMLKCGKTAGLNEKGECVNTDPNQGGVPPFVQSELSKDGKGTVIPPNCFHGNNSTNFHFHGFHVSPQRHQDDVLLELMPFPPFGMAEKMKGMKGMYGDRGQIAMGLATYDVDPIRYTQAPGTHWYHAHKHGSTALQVLNGLVGTFEIRGAFDEQLEKYFREKGGGELRARLLVVQQLQERQPGLGGADQTGRVLVNGMANPKVRMKPGEIQRWRFVGATMQASAQIKISFTAKDGDVTNPEIKQIAMDGVQFHPENYCRQPILNNPDKSCMKNLDETDEPTAFTLSPGNRVDILIKAPDEPGMTCMSMKRMANLTGSPAEIMAMADTQQMIAAKDICGDDMAGPPLLTLVVEEAPVVAMKFPTPEQFPPMPRYLNDIAPNSDGLFVQRVVNYEMQNRTDLRETQFWINQQKFDGSCVNETLTLGVAEEWTLQNNSDVAHPFHIHINPFQLIEDTNKYEAPYIWRDTLAIPTAKLPSGTKSLDPEGSTADWGRAKLRYVAEEFTGEFVNHCHILGHEDRGMMHATQAVCPNGQWGKPNLVSDPGRQCDANGFCQTECVPGNYLPATQACPPPPPQKSKWVNKVKNCPPDTVCSAAVH